MKSMLPALVFLLALVLVSLVTAPQGIAIELKIVGDSTAVTPANFYFRNYCGPLNPGPPPMFFSNDIGECYLAQAFSLSSGAWANGLTFTFVANGVGSGTYPISLAITADLNSGPVFFQTTELVSVPALSGDQFVPLSVPFPPVFLPKGSYYLKIWRDLSQNAEFTCQCGLTWAPNQIGSTEVGVLGQAFCYGVLSDDGCPTFLVSNVWSPISMDPSNPTNIAGMLCPANILGSKLAISSIMGRRASRWKPAHSCGGSSSKIERGFSPGGSS